MVTTFDVVVKFVKFFLLLEGFQKFVLRGAGSILILFTVYICNRLKLIKSDREFFAMRGYLGGLERLLLLLLTRSKYRETTQIYTNYTNYESIRIIFTL